MKKPRILVVGSINMDLLLLTSRMPAPGESILSEEYRFGPGGKGANQAVACALLGGETSFVCKVGDDAFGSQLRRSLIEKGVNAEYVSQNTGKQSGFGVIILDGDNNRIITHLASNLDLNKDDVDRAFDRDYDCMITQFEIAEEIVAYACEKARKKNIPFVVDTGPALDFPLEKLHGAEIISPNETETIALCGIAPTNEASCKEAAEILSKRTGAKHIVLKLGENGAFHYKDGETAFFTPKKVKVADVTAAGDVFTAAMCVQYFSHGDISKAIKYANIAGALTVTKAGAQQSIPTLAEVAEFSDC